MLVMKTILDQYKTPYEVSQDIARNMVKRRKEHHAKKIAEEIYAIVNEQLSDILMKKANMIL